MRLLTAGVHHRIGSLPDRTRQGKGGRGEAGDVVRGRFDDTTPDELLLRRFQEGDPSAFNPLVRRHINGVYNFIARHTSPGVQAEDLTQEVFLRAVERAPDFKYEARFSTWLYAIARNLCVDTLRKMAHRNHASLDEPGEGGAPLGEQLGDERPLASGERSAASQQLGARIQKAISDLPAEQREVFLLREIANLPFQEIATVTSTPENTVKSRMRYALERLQEALDDYAEEARSLK